MTILFANNALSTLVNPITDVATTIVIQAADAAVFPIISTVGDFYYTTLEDPSFDPPLREIIKVTNRSGSNMTVQRAQEGTVAQAFSSGAIVSLRLTSGGIVGILDAAAWTMKRYPGVLRVIENLADIADPDGVPYEDNQLGLYTGNSVIYRFDIGTSSWYPMVSATEMVGILQDSQLAGLNTAKLIGQLFDPQIANMAAAKVLGQLTNDQIAALAAAKLTGQIVETQISDDAITTPKIGAGVVITEHLFASDIVTNFLMTQLAYVGAAQIIDASITTAKIADAQITTAKIGAAQVTNATIANAQINNAKMDVLAVNTAQIIDASIVNGKIADLQVDTIKISNSAVTEAPAVSANTPLAIPIGSTTTVLTVDVYVIDSAKVIITAKCVTSCIDTLDPPNSGGESGGI